MPRVRQQPTVSEEASQDMQELREIFVRSYDETPLKKVFLRESDVVKELDRINVKENEWPEYELRDVTAVDQNGNVANLLFCAKDGPVFTVQGQLIVDQEFAKNLRTYRKKGYTNLNGSYVQVAKPDNVSIGYDPGLALWISSVSGWLEIQPSAEYRPIYEEIMIVIGVYFSAIVHSEDRAKDGVVGPLTVGEEVRVVLNHYFVMNGGAAKLCDVVKACKGSKSFLIDQFRKKVVNEYWVAEVKTWKWLNSGFYRWLLADCPANPPDNLPIDAFVARTVPPVLPPKPRGFRTRRSPTPIKTARAPSISRSQSESPADPGPSQTYPYKGFPPGMATSFTYNLANGDVLVVDRHPRDVKSPTSSPPATTAHHGPYLSPEFPKGIAPNMGMIEKFIVVGLHAMACDRFAQLNASTLAQAVYWDYQINDFAASRQLIYYYRKEIAAKFLELGLAKYGNESVIYKTLLATKPVTTLKDYEVDNVYAITDGGKELLHRAKKDKARERKASSVPASVPVSTPAPAAPAPDAPATDPRISRSREPSPAPEEGTKVDSVGKVIPKRIKRGM